MLLLSMLAACLPGPALGQLLPDQERAPVRIRESCTIAATKCTRCHSIDRVLVAQVQSPHQWETYVGRMRRMTASGISEADAPRIVECLVYRSFGQEENREAITGK